MKKSVYVCLMCLAMIWLASCSSEKKYVNVLPENPGAVVSVDLKQLVQKSDLSAEDTKAVVTEIKNTLGNGLDAQGTELIDKVLADPSESGLDLKQKVYLFVDDKGEKGGLLACVQDKGKLNELVGLLGKQQPSAAIEDKGAYSQVVQEQGVLAYSDCSCLLLFSDKGKDADLQTWASELMGGENKNSFCDSKGFESMEKIKGDISVFMSMVMLPEEYKMMAKMSMPATVDWKDVNIVAGVHFEKGRMVLDIETLINDALKKEYEKIRPIYSKETTDKFLKMFPKGSFMWVDMGLKGDKLYETLMKEPAMAAQLGGVQTMFDLKSALSAIDGETVICISNLEPLSFALMAEVENSDFMQSFESLKPMLDMTRGQMKLVETGKNAYELQMADGRMMGVQGNVSIYIGVKDGVFYLTNDKMCAEQKEADNSMKNESWAGNVPGKRCFFVMNCYSLNEIMNANHQVYSSKDQLTQRMLSVMDYMTVEAEDDTHGRMELGMKDKETNVLKQWISLGKELAVR